MNTQKGIAPIIIIALVVLVGGGTFAVVQRNVLKSFFEKGDKPVEVEGAKPGEQDRTELKGKFQDGDIPTGDEKVSGDKPAETDFADTIDSSLNMVDDGLTSYKTAPVVLTESKKEFSLDEKSGAVTFRWTPLVPKPKEPVTYRLKVWQLMQGQNSTEAMRTNQPIVTKDVDNVAEVTVSGIYTGPCRPPYLCEFVWAVEIITKVTTPTPASATDPTQASEVKASVEAGGALPLTDTGSR